MNETNTKAVRCVIVESPFAAPTEHGVDENVRYARAAVRDCLMRGESPYASHLLYTQPGILRDDEPDERVIGMFAGFAWIERADATVVYVDRGISKGMKSGASNARNRGKPIEIRSLHEIDPATLNEYARVLGLT